MTKVLLVILKVMTGFIFIVAFIEAVKLTVKGIKSGIKMMRLGGKKLTDWTHEKEEQYRIKKEQKRQEKLNKKMNKEVNEATGA